MTSNKPSKSMSFSYAPAYLAWSLPALATLATPAYIMWQKHLAGVERFPLRRELALQFQFLEASVLVAGLIGLLIIALNLVPVLRRAKLLPDRERLGRWIVPTLLWAGASYWLIFFYHGALLVSAGFAGFYVYGRRKLSREQQVAAGFHLAVSGLVLILTLGLLRLL